MRNVAAGEAHAYQGRKRVLSGVQPTGNLHLGNYLGAIRKFVELQDQYECLYCIVDLHAITVWQEPAALRQHVREVAAAYLAAGVSPEKAIIFAQSAVPAHSELAWIFNCIARMGWLNRMTQFKDKAGKDKERACVGLFAYPTLMAADILVYKATHVPVGDDQKQHLELARDIAMKFNNDFKRPDFFPLPTPLIQGAGARIMNLKDGTKKMSKSDPADTSRINLTDTADAIARKIKRATTDTAPVPCDEVELADRPEVANLVGIYAALSGQNRQQVLDQYGGQGFGVFKPALAELAVDQLTPISTRMNEIIGDKNYLDEILAMGAARAAALAAPVVKDIKEIMGLAA